jgi:hypothetical protein
VSAGLLTGLLPGVLPAIAQEAGATLELRPFCESGYAGTEWIYGPVPPPDWTPGSDPELCAPFDVRDPQTLQTEPFSIGDEIKLDLVVQNPMKKPISGVRTWISYDATILEGKEIVINQEIFPEVIPGEADFAAKNGFVKIQVNASDKAYPSTYWVRVATVTFTVTKEILPGTVLSFFDVQRDGHTYILASENGTETYALAQEPGSLFVQLEKSAGGSPAPVAASGSTLVADGSACVQSSDCRSGQCTDSICAPTSDAELTACTFDGQCPSATCYEGFCRDANFRIPNDQQCRRDAQCSSGTCRNGLCSGLTNQPDGTGCASGLECASGRCESGVCHAQPAQAAGSCFFDTDCTNSGTCVNGLCSSPSTAPAALIPTGGTCVLSTQCQSTMCVEGICRDQETYENDRTAFALLQVRNLRATTEGGIAYLQWDALRSSMLKGYNVYYGSTSGQYIQRKTIPATNASVSIRNLPEGETYYFAVRAVSGQDEESAFSQEVSMEIGNPSTSTAPLVASILTDAPGENPVVTGGAGTLPGETGMGTTLAIFMLISAVIGTILASRRQLTAVAR